MMRAISPPGTPRIASPTLHQQASTYEEFAVHMSDGLTTNERAALAATRVHSVETHEATQKKTLRTQRARLADSLRLTDKVDASRLADEPPWNAVRLLAELREMLSSAPIRPPLTAEDLVKSWDKGTRSGQDKDGDGQVSSREYMIALKRLVDGKEDLWYSMLRAGAIEAFYQIDHSSDGSLSKAELCRWIDPKHGSTGGGGGGAGSRGPRSASPTVQRQMAMGAQRLQEEKEKERLRRMRLWAPRVPPAPVVFLNNGKPAFGGGLRKWRGEPMHAWQGTVVQPGAAGPKAVPPVLTTTPPARPSTQLATSSPARPSSPRARLSPGGLSTASATTGVGSQWSLSPSRTSRSGARTAGPKTWMAAATALSDSAIGRAFPTAAQLNLEIDLGDRMALRREKAEPKAPPRDPRRPVSAPSPRRGTALRMLQGPTQGTANLFHRMQSTAKTK